MRTAYCWPNAAHGGYAVVFGELPKAGAVRVLWYEDDLSSTEVWAWGYYGYGDLYVQRNADDLYDEQLDVIEGWLRGERIDSGYADGWYELTTGQQGVIGIPSSDGNIGPALFLVESDPAFPQRVMVDDSDRIAEVWQDGEWVRAEVEA